MKEVFHQVRTSITAPDFCSVLCNKGVRSTGSGRAEDTRTQTLVCEVTINVFLCGDFVRTVWSSGTRVETDRYVAVPIWKRLTFDRCFEHYCSMDFHPAYSCQKGKTSERLLVFASAHLIFRALSGRRELHLDAVQIDPDPAHHSKRIAIERRQEMTSHLLCELQD